jgi:hypothetical protein
MHLETGESKSKPTKIYNSHLISTLGKVQNWFGLSFISQATTASLPEFKACLPAYACHSLK